MSILQFVIKSNILILWLTLKKLRTAHTIKVFIGECKVFIAECKVFIAAQKLSQLSQLGNRVSNPRLQNFLIESQT